MPFKDGILICRFFKHGCLYISSTSFFVILHKFMDWSFHSNVVFSDTFSSEFMKSFHIFALFCSLWLINFVFRFLLLFIQQMCFSGQSKHVMSRIPSTEGQHTSSHETEPCILIYPNHNWFTSDLFHMQLHNVSQTLASTESSHQPVLSNDIVLHINPWNYFTYLHSFGIIVFVLAYSFSSVFFCSFWIVTMTCTLLHPFVFPKNVNMIRSTPFLVQPSIYISLLLGQIFLILYSSQFERYSWTTSLEQLNTFYGVLITMVLPFLCTTVFLKLQSNLYQLRVQINTVFNFLIPSISGISLFYLFLYAYLINIYFVFEKDNVTFESFDLSPLQPQHLFFLLLPILFFSINFYILKVFLSNDYLKIQNFLIIILLSHVTLQYVEAKQSELMFLHPSCIFLVVAFLFQLWIEHRYDKLLNVENCGHEIWIEQSVEQIQT